MKTIKQQRIDALQKFGVYEKWRENTLNFNKSEDEIENILNNEKYSLADIMVMSFSWDKTEEKFDFWYTIWLKLKA